MLTLPIVQAGLSHKWVNGEVVPPRASAMTVAGSQVTFCCAAKSRAIAIPVDLDSQVNNLFLKSHNIVQKTALNWRLSARNAARRDSVLAASRDYRNIIERLQVMPGAERSEPLPGLRRCARTAVLPRARESSRLFLERSQCMMSGKSNAIMCVGPGGQSNLGGEKPWSSEVLHRLTDFSGKSGDSALTRMALWRVRRG